MRGALRGLFRYGNETPHFCEFDRANGEPHMTDGKGEVGVCPWRGENEMGARLKADAIWTQ